MPIGARKPFVGTAPILDEPPADTDWGQLVRHIGPIDIAGPVDVEVVNTPDVNVVNTPDVNVVNTVDVNVVTPITVTASEPKPSSTTVTQVAVTVVATTLAAANVNRIHLLIFNEATARTLYVKFGAGVSTTSFSIKIAPGGFYELDFPVYTGIVTGLWSGAAAAQYAYITEMT